MSPAPSTAWPFARIARAWIRGAAAALRRRLALRVLRERSGEEPGEWPGLELAADADLETVFEAARSALGSMGWAVRVSFGTGRAAGPGPSITLSRNLPGLVEIAIAVRAARPRPARRACAVAL